MTQSVERQHRTLSGSYWKQRLLTSGLCDTLSSKRHSRDFNFARGEYLRLRTQVVAVVFMFLAPLWILIDYLLLPSELLNSLAVGRFMLMAVLGGVLYVVNLSQHQLTETHLALAGLLLAPVVFYLGLALYYGAALQDLVGYEFIPLLIIAFLSVFPLTLLESLAIGLSVIALQLLVWLRLDFFAHPEVWPHLGLLLVLLAISLWANHAQVSTLLRLYRQASKDSLTGLLNRGVLLEQLQRICQQREDNLDQEELPEPISLLLFDLDRFKNINDTYGHAAGDLVLQTFAKILSQELRHKDLFGRYGGEEFVVVLTNTSRLAAQKVAERIRIQCAAARVKIPGGKKLSFTTSIGITEIRLGEDLDNALHRADQRLYLAKKLGRNRYIAFDPVDEQDINYDYF